MANRTITGAMSIHGSDPQRLIEKIIRERIYDNLYWKEECFGLNAANVIEKAVALNHIGGLYGNQRPTPFLCLLLKTLQLQPEKDIILEYIGNTKFKYVAIHSTMRHMSLLFSLFLSFIISLIVSFIAD